MLSRLFILLLSFGLLSCAPANLDAEPAMDLAKEAKKQQNFEIILNQ